MSPELLNTASLVKLTIKADGSFLYVDSGMPKSGNVSISGDTLTLNVEMMLNQPLSRQPQSVQDANGEIELVRQADGDLELKGSSLELSRVKAASESGS